MNSYDMKVVGYETIDADDSENAFEIFDKMMRDGYTISDLRWKTIDVESHVEEVYTLPNGSVTHKASTAATEWAKAFYKLKDALTRVRPVPERLIAGVPIRDLDEILGECDQVLLLGGEE